MFWQGMMVPSVCVAVLGDEVSCNAIMVVFLHQVAAIEAVCTVVN